METHESTMSTHLVVDSILSKLFRTLLIWPVLLATVSKMITKSVVIPSGCALSKTFIKKVLENCNVLKNQDILL